LAQITIRWDHELNKPIKQWMLDQGIGKSTRGLTLQSLSASRRSDIDDDECVASDKLILQPDPGSYTLRFNGHRVTFQIEELKQQEIEYLTKKPVFRHESGELAVTTVVISCTALSGGMKVLRDFLEYVQALESAKLHSMVTVHRPEVNNRFACWDSGINRPWRSLESVMLPDDVKLPLIEDIGTYLSSETQRFYASRGIPWRRGYLLYGPPGTGKTSLSIAIASRFKLKVYNIDLTTPNMSDAILDSLFQDLPEQCVMLLEDIDSAGVKREHMKSATSKDEDEDDSPGEVTLSGLLNVIDGPAAKDGRILIMTTNTPESLDAALVRPGRIDRKTYMGNATTEVLVKMFKHIFIPTPEEIATAQTASLAPEQIEHLAQKFAGAIGSEMFSPAEMQGYLVQYRADAHLAADNAAAWAKEALAVKQRSANVAESRMDPVADRKNSTEDGPRATDGDSDDEKDKLSRDEAADSDDESATNHGSGTEMGSGASGSDTDSVDSSQSDECPQFSEENNTVSATVAVSP
jgi:chaperone BCS1